MPYYRNEAKSGELAQYDADRIQKIANKFFEEAG